MIVQSQGINFVINSFALISAYITSVTLAGAFQAWISKKMGDHLPESQGFLTLDPFTHIDFIGAFCLLCFGIGWGKFMTFDYITLHGWRLLAVLFSRSCMYLLLSYSAYAALITIFGISILPLVAATANHSISITSTTLFLLYRAYPAYSSFTLLVGLFLIMLMYIGFMMASIHIILKLIKIAEIKLLPKINMHTNDFILYVGAFFAMLILGPLLRTLFLQSIINITYLGIIMFN